LFVYFTYVLVGDKLEHN